MPWNETNRVNERMKFVNRLLTGERMTDLCREFGISRELGYRIKRRFEELGPAGFLDQSRAPRQIPHRTSTAIRELVAETRKTHPTWGPRKLKAWLEANKQGVRLPAASTIGDILKELGLVAARKRRRTGAAKPTGRTEPTAPNEVWCADFKGQFRLGDGSYCYPLTITDARSRFLIACEGLDGTKAGPAQTVFEIAFREYGLPKRIRTDNGAPFASAGLAGLTALSAWWLRLGIDPERIEPGCPQQNGQHERMHRTLKAETARPAAQTMLRQQDRFDRFRTEFNEQRPHEALGQRPPSSAYRTSEKTYEEAEANGPEYPLSDLVLNVSSSGSVWLPDRRCVYLAAALAGHSVGLREVDDDRWLVVFMNLELGHIEPELGFDPIVA